MDVSLYIVEGCWLCDYAEELLNSFREQYGLKIKKIDITSSYELYERFRFDVPVVEFENGKTLKGRIKKKELLAELESLKP